MRVVVLTTETTHHVQFVKEVAKTFPIECVLVETKAVTAPFATEHSFERERDRHEREVFFGGKNPSISTIAETRFFDNISDRTAVAAMGELKADVAVVFGTGRLTPALLAACPGSVINLHGGDPEEYRGLDSHLWSIYHSDFAGLVSTIHLVNAVLDDGDILFKRKLKLKRGMRLYELRSLNTSVCIELALVALSAFNATGRCESTAQTKKGRYYSFMPTELKEVCRAKFEKYTAALND